MGWEKSQVWFTAGHMEGGLLPRDGIHLQVMKEYGIRHIVSTDTDFDQVAGVERIGPGHML